MYEIDLIVEDVVMESASEELGISEACKKMTEACKREACGVGVGKRNCQKGQVPVTEEAFDGAFSAKLTLKINDLLKLDKVAEKSIKKLKDDKLPKYITVLEEEIAALERGIKTDVDSTTAKRIGKNAWYYISGGLSSSIEAFKNVMKKDKSNMEHNSFPTEVLKLMLQIDKRNLKIAKDELKKRTGKGSAVKESLFESYFGSDYNYVEEI